MRAKSSQHFRLCALSALVAVSCFLNPQPDDPGNQNDKSPSGGGDLPAAGGSTSSANIPAGGADAENGWLSQGGSSSSNLASGRGGNDGLGGLDAPTGTNLAAGAPAMQAAAGAVGLAGSAGAAGRVDDTNPDRTGAGAGFGGTIGAETDANGTAIAGCAGSLKTETIAGAAGAAK